MATDKKEQSKKDKANRYVKMRSFHNGLTPFKSKKSNVFTFNPANEDKQREEPTASRLILYSYDKESGIQKEFSNAESLLKELDSQKKNWIHIVGLKTEDVSRLCRHFNIHQLTIEDILSAGQRAKTDELGNGVFCLLPELHYSQESDEVEQSQISLILLENTVLSFTNIVPNDLFTPIRSKMLSGYLKFQMKNSDFLFYTLLDAIVDDYFLTIEQVGIQIEEMETIVLKRHNSRTLVQLNQFRQKTGTMKRTITPVRELVNNILKTENNLIEKKTRTYIKDVYDHILQAHETIDSYRDLIMNLQNLSINQVSLKMNEVMKVLAIVTALFAPLTLIAGIYGMNFDNMPELHTRFGYFITLGVMALLLLLMLYIFKKRKWF